MKIKPIAILCLCFGLMSCATAPVQRQVPSSFPFDKPFDPVWQAVIETFAELNLPILNMEKASGLITTDWISFRGQDNTTGYCACGGLGTSVEVDRRGRFNVYVKKVGESSCELKVNSVFENNTRSALVKDSLISVGNCVSTGKLEAEIYKRVSEKMK
jgi:uncharacterized lipoprotein